MSTMTVTKMTALGQSIPAHHTHGISVSLPTWKDTVGYEEGEDRVVKAMVSGYPRFFVNLLVRKLEGVCLRKFGSPLDRCHIFPTERIANKCREFLHAHSPDPSSPIPVRIAQFWIHPTSPKSSSTAAAPANAPSSSRTSDEFHAENPSVQLHVVLFPSDAAALAKAFWQHTGTGISSRLAEYCLDMLPADVISPSAPTPEAHVLRPLLPKAKNRHYSASPKNALFAAHGTSSNPAPSSSFPSSHDVSQNAVTTEVDHEVMPEELKTYLEERYARNLPKSQGTRSKRALRRRIAGDVSREDDDGLDPGSPNEENFRGEDGPNRCCLKEEDVFLYPTGMTAIWSAHQLLLAALEPAKSVVFGFPYTDTSKITEKWGPGCHFLGNGSIDELESLLRPMKTLKEASGKATSPEDRILALFCEFPSNPLLRAPDLVRIRELADQYGFAIVVDETIGSFANVDVLPFADIVVSSLSKIFSGDANVMGGSLVLNRRSRYYETLRKQQQSDFEDYYWNEDAIYLERNSRNFASRVARINHNTDALCEMLRKRSLRHSKSSQAVIKDVLYPKWVTREVYDQCRIGAPGQVHMGAKTISPTLGPHEEGGFGGLFSLTFTSEEASKAFFDALECEKGPSLGTNFTLVCPYTILAHYHELEWAQSFGVEAGIVRVSVGLEETEALLSTFDKALQIAERYAL